MEHPAPASEHVLVARDGPIVTLTFNRPPFVGFVTEATKRAEVDAVISGLEAARDAG